MNTEKNFQIEESQHSFNFLEDESLKSYEKNFSVSKPKINNTLSSNFLEGIDIDYNHLYPKSEYLSDLDISEIPSRKNNSENIDEISDSFINEVHFYLEELDKPKNLVKPENIYNENNLSYSWEQHFDLELSSKDYFHKEEENQNLLGKKRNLEHHTNEFDAKNF